MKVAEQIGPAGVEALWMVLTSAGNGEGEFAALLEKIAAVLAKASSGAYRGPGGDGAEGKEPRLPALLRLALLPANPGAASATGQPETGGQVEENGPEEPGAPAPVLPGGLLTFGVLPAGEFVPPRDELADGGKSTGVKPVSLAPVGGAFRTRPGQAVPAGVPAEDPALGGEKNAVPVSQTAGGESWENKSAAYSETPGGKNPGQGLRRGAEGPEKPAFFRELFLQDLMRGGSGGKGPPEGGKISWAAQPDAGKAEAFNGSLAANFLERRPAEGGEAGVRSLPNLPEQPEGRGSFTFAAVESRRPPPDEGGGNSTSIIRQVAEKLELLPPRTAERSGEVRVQLHPPHLGEVTVRVRREGKRLVAEVLTESTAVKDLVESRLGELRQRFSQLNLPVERLSVSVGSESGTGREGAGQRPPGNPPWRGLAPEQRPEAPAGGEEMARDCACTAPSMVNYLA